MVQSIIELDEEKNRVLNIVKAQNGFKNKSQAVGFVLEVYADSFLEPELRPKYIKKMLKRKNEATAKVDNFATHFGLNDL